MAAASGPIAGRAIFSNIPGPKAYPVVGSTFSFVGGFVSGLKVGRPYDFANRWFEEYGPIVAVDAMGLGKAVLLGDPEHIKWVCRNDPARFTKGNTYDSIKRGWLDDSIVVSEGASWRKKRDLYNKAFRIGAIRTYAPTFAAIAETTGEAWKQAAAEGQPVDAVKTFEGVALEAIGQAGFGLQGLGAPNNEYAEAFVKYTAILNKEFNSLPRRLMPASMSKQLSLSEGQGYLDTMTEESKRIVAKAMENTTEAAQGTQRNLVALMQEACAEEEVNDMDPAQLAREANLFLFAGHDTTSSTLSWLWAHLGTHPEVQQKIFEEVSSIPANEDVVSVLADPRALPYLNSVIKETLRLNPPAPLVVRCSKFDEELGGTAIPAGTNYMPVIWAIHRTPKAFEDPHEFRPERWATTDAEQVKRMQDHWMPFMIGARSCIGQQFSLMEMRVVVATLIKRFSVKLVSEPQVISQLLLLPSNIKLQCIERH
eukprot:CAMPEP_0206452592 /NCGR_PEP_ID=MMETSP0324_2-20121206/20039_1 /ASSEMBLY_ACC=CAM_ASM_000836 /TAXON_ID=2866 /ORGANISM="Crypthecodinium cohnii, Strain Seligo" /LENGTH=481 /DNA_ID=CAMNT_0053922715 /DNA_START=63 /DNA_END=1508 /DNA_ORIENTATION=-